MNRVRRFMGLSSSSPLGQPLHSIPAQQPSHATAAAPINMYAEVYHQHQTRRYPTAEALEEQASNELFAGVNLGSGKMTVSKSGRWKKKERRRLSLWDEDGAEPGQGAAAAPSNAHHAHGAGHIVFKELGRGKRSKAPLPPAGPVPARCRPKPYQPAEFVGIGVRGTCGPPEPTPRRSTRVPGKNSLTLRNEKVNQSVRQVFGNDDEFDDAAIAQLIEDFDATIRMHEEQLGVDDDNDVDENSSRSPPNKGSTGRPGHVRKMSGPTSASVQATVKPAVIPRQQQRVVSPRFQHRRH